MSHGPAMTPAGQAAADRAVLRSQVRPSDVAAVRDIVGSSGFFSAAELDVAVELVEDRLAKGEASDYRFLFADLDGQRIGYACYGPIACTAGSFDLYWIAVHEGHRGRGLGRRLMAATEGLIRKEGGHRVYVETSSRAQYAPTREFYLKCGYRIEATLEDFYAPGDSKVILAMTL
jgi:GNAT superfamily N-acetyltransferase